MVKWSDLQSNLKFNYKAKMAAVLVIILSAIVIFGLIILTQLTSKFVFNTSSKRSAEATIISFEDELEGLENIDFENFSGFRQLNGKMEMTGQNGKIGSKCFDFNYSQISFPQQKDLISNYDNFLINLNNVGNKYVSGQIKLQSCRGGKNKQVYKNLNIWELKNGLNVVDIRDLEKNKVRGGGGYSLEIDFKLENIFMSPFISLPVIDSWGISGSGRDLIGLEIKSLDQNIVIGKKSIFSVRIWPKIADLPASKLEIAVEKGKIDSGNGKINSEIVNLKSLKSSGLNFDRAVLADEGSDLIQIKINYLGQKISSDKIYVVASPAPNLLGYDRYSNLSTKADKLWSIFFIENNGLLNNGFENNRVAGNLKVESNFEGGDCKPFYLGAGVKKLLDNDNFDKLGAQKDIQIVTKIEKEPEKNKPTQGNIVLDIEKWDFNSIYYGLVLDYEIAGSKSCPNGSKLVISTTLLEKKSGKVLDLKKITHIISDSPCSFQEFPSRDVIRLDQKTLKPQKDYWPELRISREENCYREKEILDINNNRIDKNNNDSINDSNNDAPLDNSPFGYVNYGEYVMTNYWHNEGYRKQTVENIDWFYVLNPLPVGVSFHGSQLDLSIRNDGNFYPIRPENTLDGKNVEYYKADLKIPGTLRPDNPEFDHFNPENSGWNRVLNNITPFTGEGDLKNDIAPLYSTNGSEMAVIARGKDIKPAWEKDFFLPTFILKICDGSFNCPKLPTGTVLKLNEMETFAFVKNKNKSGKNAGICNYCGKSSFGTVKIGPFSYPMGILSSGTISFKRETDFNFTLNPENIALSSVPINGKWYIDISGIRDLIDFENLSVGVVCQKGDCLKPEKCEISEIIKNQKIDKNLGIILWDLDKTPNCFIPVGSGRYSKNDVCRDGYNQNFIFSVSGKFKNYDPTSAGKYFVRSGFSGIGTIAPDKIPQSSSRENKLLEINLN